MRLPVIRGTIDRRILANYRINPEVLRSILPPPFRPKLVGGFGMGGICLIRLKSVRPNFFPFPWGISSENAAHRIAVEWDVHGKTVEGVYIPRRDTSSRLNTLVGGRIFPGVHHHARFVVSETQVEFSVALASIDGKTSVRVSGQISNDFPDSSVFPTLSDASDFFRNGSLGYSATNASGRYDGLELRCSQWKMENLNVFRMESSFFDDERLFPIGTIYFDCALLMRNIEHEWHGREDLRCSPGS